MGDRLRPRLFKPVSFVKRFPGFVGHLRFYHQSRCAGFKRQQPRKIQQPGPDPGSPATFVDCEQTDGNASVVAGRLQGKEPVGIVRCPGDATGSPLGIIE